MGVAKEEDPQLTVIQKTIPAVCDRLRTIAGVVQTGLESNDCSIRRMEGRMAALENVVSDFCSGAFNLTFIFSSYRAQKLLLLYLLSFPYFFITVLFFRLMLILIVIKRLVLELLLIY